MRLLAQCVLLCLTLEVCLQQPKAAAAAAAAAAASAAAAAAAAGLPSCGATPSGRCLRQQAAALHAWAVDIRRQLHRQPELMYEEQRTSILVQQVLTGLGIKFSAGWGRDRRASVIVESLLEASTLRGDAEELQQLQQQQQQQVWGTGVVAEIGTGEEPCVLLRADMDALPIQEMADVPFKSEVEGKMHACGHDAHTTMLLMAAAILKQNEKALKGTVRVVFQPAEEGGQGATMMIEEGLLEKEPKPLLALGLHALPDLPTGAVASREGPLMGATSNFHFEVLGRGGHAALPAQTIDPLAACAAAVQQTYAMVARENDFGAFSSGFVSFTQIQAGSAYNVIPSSCTLKGTIRAFSLEKLHALQQRLREVVQKTAEAFRCKLSVRRLHTVTPPVSVDKHALGILRKAVDEVGESPLETLPAMYGGEDFAFFLQKIPGVFAFLGIGFSLLASSLYFISTCLFQPPSLFSTAAECALMPLWGCSSGEQNQTNPVKTTFGLHHPQFAVDENALQVGAAVEAQFAFSAIEALLQQQQQQQQRQQQQQQHGEDL
ncbi:hypothetical protein Esti_006708 [Eimeria stiedai]